MDPITALGAAGSVVGIAGFGIQLAQILRKYLSQIWNAQESLESIVEEIEITTSALEEIYVFLEQEVATIKRGQALQLFSGNSLEKVKETADKCLVIFWRVEATISGNWPAGIEAQLVKKLIEFNNKLTHYSPNAPITIELELNSDPLGLRDKLRWPNKASKLDKYCKQLQRYQDSLVLLLQVVSLGQQRLKPNPTERDTRLMLRTYAIISTLASPQDLQIIAWETQTQSQTQPRTATREPSIAPSHFKKIRTTCQPTDDKLPTARVPGNPLSRGFGNAETRSIVIDVPTPRKPQPSSNGIITNGPVIPWDSDIGNPQSTSPRGIRAHKPLVHFSSSVDGTEQQGEQMEPVSRPSGNDKQRSSGHRTVDGGDVTTTTPLPKAQVNNAALNGQTAASEAMKPNSEQAARPATHETPVNPSQGAMFTNKPAHSENLEAKLIYPSQSLKPGEDSLKVADQSGKQPQDKINPENLSVEDALASNMGQKEVQILPYVLYEGGAYQLPVSLGLEMKSKVRGGLSSIHSGKELTERLAFLNPGQVQTLQSILRDNSGDQSRKLAHLEVLKKSSMRFWRRPTKVMIAFIEGETSNMPRDVSLPLAGIQDVNLNMHQTSVLTVPQQKMSVPHLTPQPGSDSVPDSPTTDPNRAKLTTNSQKQDIHQRESNPNPTTSIHTFSLPSSSRVAGISGVQDVTALLLETDEWRERFTEYKVWTIRPFLGIEQTETSGSLWDRCVIAEEYLSNYEVSRRLAALDKNPMTILEKLATLAVSQQIQVQQSLEAAKSNGYDPSRQWKFRQLDIIRSKKWFRPTHVKRVIVYACIELLPPASKQPEESQRELPAVDNPSFANHIAGSIQPDSETKVQSAENNKSRHHRHDKSWEGTTNTDSDNSSFKESKQESSRTKSKIKLSEHRLDTIRDDAYRRGRASRQREVELANAAIASRPAGSPRPHLSSIRSHNSAESLRSTSSGPIAYNNRVYDYSYYKRPGSDVYSERDNYRNAIVATGHQSKIDRMRDRLRHEYEWVERNFPSRSRSSSPRYGRSVATSRTSRTRPRLLSFYTSDELRARTRSQARAGTTYPDGFDKEPYDPQLSPQDAEAQQEAIEQLLLEWTPLYKADKDSDNDEVDAEDSKEHEAAFAFPSGQDASSGTVMDEPEMLDSAVDQAAETAGDAQSETLPEVEDSILKGISAGVNIDDTNLRWGSQSPYIGVGASYGEPQPRPLQRSGRAVTLPPPARQSWTGPDWARQIVEETATVADPDDYELPLRSPPAPQDRREGRQRGSASLRAGRERDTERYTSPTTKHPRERGRVDQAFGVDLEQRPTPPRRRRTVEFEESDHPVVSRGRDRDRDAAVNRRSYLSESRPRPRSRVRDRAPLSETQIERESRHRSRSRYDRQPSRR